MNVYIASGHRTGSMHIAHSLAKIIDFQATSAIPAPSKYQGSDEHMIQPMAAQTLFLLDKLVFHNHCRGTAGNAAWLKRFDVPVLVTVRNIYDQLWSLMEKANLGIPIPGVVLPIPWSDWPDERKWRCMAYNVAPWELQFYASWAVSGVKRVRWCVYGQFYADEVAGMTKIIEWLGLPVDKKKITAELKADKTNLNVGGSGRGVKGVPDFVKEIVLDQIDSWGTELKPHMLRDLT